MWYVIQTRSGDEQEIKQYIENSTEAGICKVILPLYEDVYRKGGTGHIVIKKLFPGYLFIDTEEPKEVYKTICKVPRFTRMLSIDEKDMEKTFLTVSIDDEEFINSLTDDGLMQVSYIRRSKSGRIEKITGPLNRYAGNITKLDIPHRRAIVEADILGKHRRIKYPLWTDADPHLDRFDEVDVSQPSAVTTKICDIGIHEGDIVKDETGIYGDLEFTVIKVDPARRMIRAEAEMFGTKVCFEMSADNVGAVKSSV